MIDSKLLSDSSYYLIQYKFIEFNHTRLKEPENSKLLMLIENEYAYKIKDFFISFYKKI